MGSKTSTRWKGHKARMLTDECCALRVDDLRQALSAGPERGTLRWHKDQEDWHYNRPERVQVEYYRSTLNASCWMLTTLHPFIQCFTLREIPSPIGATRRVLCCPQCQKHFTVLYLAPGISGFYCRRCLRLAYASNRKRQAQPRYHFVPTSLAGYQARFR